MKALETEQGLAAGGAQSAKESRSQLAKQLLAFSDKTRGGLTWMDRLGTKIDQYGIQRPEVLVKYKDLVVTTQALVGAASLPTVISPFVTAGKHLACMQGKEETKPLHLLDGMSGVLKPGRITLLLGPPSSGKSTFMKLLAGRLKESSIMKVEGGLWFNGLTPDQFDQPRSCVYAAQVDNHEPNITVNETLDFAYFCQVGTKEPGFNMPKEIYHKKLAVLEAGDMEAGVLSSPKVAHNGTHGLSHSTPSGSDTPGSPASPAKDGITTTSNNNNHNQSGGNPAVEHLRGLGGEHRSDSKRSAFSFRKGKSGRSAGHPGVEMDDFEETLAKVWGTGVKVDVVMNLLGLVHCRDTMVGNEVFRGISGGEKKRLTTAEQLLGPQNVLVLDEISTGLDSATLFAVISWLAKWCHALHKTTIISLLQPPPEVFQMFDDVIIFSAGKTLYHGPVQEAVPFFSSLGFECPPRKDIPSFLLEVTTAKGQLEYASASLRAAHNLPATGSIAKMSRLQRKQMIIPLDDMATAFWTNNKYGQAMAQELQSVGSPPPTGRHPADLITSRQHALSPLQAIMAATQRQVTLVLRDKVLLKGRLVQVTVLSLMCSSLFYNLGVSLIKARTFFGFCFLMTLFINFGGFPQLPITVEAKKVWFKHRSNSLLPAYAQGLAMTIAQVPLSLLESIVFSLIMYFMVDLYLTAGHFFTFFLIAFTMSVTASCLFRAIGCISPNMVIANAISGVLVVTLVMSSGFAILRFDIPSWMIWAYWLSPMAWTLRAFAINELTTPKWQSDPYPDNPSLTLGDGALESFGFFTERYWIWLGIGVQFAMCIGLTLFSIFCLWFLQPETPRATLPDEEALAAAREAAESHRQQLAVARAEAEAEAAATSPKPLSPGAKMPSLRKVGTFSGIDISSSLEFTPIVLVFQDLGYSVPNPNYSRKAARKAAAQAAADPTSHHAANGGSGGADLGHVSAGSFSPKVDVVQPRLQLLSHITGYSEPGVLMALMGGSGAGKTTLMDCLAGRKTIGEITGSITVNGHPKDQATWSRVVGYCEQTDIHTPLQTVKEALLFSGRLRLPATIPDVKVQAFVDEVMDIVDLIDIQYNLVGTPGVSGLSVEQRKRLSIGVELVANPSMVFMDEPTSGLDARAAAIVMQAVRNVARNGRTVMVTIHQPSIEIFEAFDMLLLIQRGGRATYFGPLGEHSSELINYLMAVPGTPPLVPGFNPATWMLEVTGGSMATMVDPVQVNWPDIYEASALHAAAEQHAAALLQHARDEGMPPLSITSTYAMPFGVQFRWLLAKFNKMYFRNPSYNLVRFFITFTTSWIYTAVYWEQGEISNPATIANAQAIMGLMYSSTNFLGMINLMTIMPLCGYERVVFYRERGASMYNPFAYGLAMSVVELPYLAIQALIYVPIMYWTVHFSPTASQFFYYLIMFFETITLYNIFGQFLVYITPAQGIAQVVGGGLNFIFNIFNGFVITYPDMPKGWRWLNRIVPTTWIMYGLGTSQLDRPDIPIFYNGQKSTLREFMEQRFGYYHNLQWWCLLIVLAYIAFMRVTSVLALRYWNFLRR